MRVKRSLTEAFSNDGFKCGDSLAESASGEVRGDFRAPSRDLIDDGFELGADIGFDGGTEAAGIVVRGKMGGWRKKGRGEMATVGTTDARRAVQCRGGVCRYTGCAGTIKVVDGRMYISLMAWT